ncbi:acetyl-CoA carboxylase carboxyltransferase subunit alpha [Porphyrobacter sp. ULC335]|uniref:acetyl-CoA carboxylase carboxyltransferase subunit alpha n=1 Tax=Porphyrobacter sp. ULC335 TaxID=2854260 RepID=UPI00221E71B7|nr:acetyl-CoA carboxylase carboxyltransferase subunit alpha [Porphyrobacter sp. ULC335]UYV17266.1 acetyl-CoA carboxylase carboxyltransferase subunit alpha [Porphyrobacter sp. ULC335]
MIQYLPFEKPIEALDKHVAELSALAEGTEEARMLRERADKLLADTYARLSPWERTLVARHPQRPRFEKLVAGLFTDFLPIAGDRVFGEDQAIIGGFARFEGRKVMVIGHVKGEDTPGRLRHNFGMARPEGYRKAIRLMELADRFGLPVVTLVDTPGAFPGIDAEARGQAEAIARSTEACLGIGVPLIAVIIGEGGSGGAVALAAANRVLMFEHAVYSVISPEGCASILWRSAAQAATAAEAMKVTATDLLKLGVIHRIVYEPKGGAHRDPQETVKRLTLALRAELDALAGLTPAELRREREEFFLRLG